MSFYLVTLLGSVGLALCAERVPLQGRRLAKGQLDPTWVNLLIVFLVVISGFRYMNFLYSDEYNYRMGVLGAIGEPFDWSQVGIDEEWLYYWLTWICANVFGSDQALIFITALVTNVLIVKFFAKFARPFWFAIFLYIASGAYIASMNVLRQYMAIAILLWCYPLAQKRKPLRYVALVVLAAFFHQSAWIMLAAYPVLRRKRFDWWTGLIIVLALIVFSQFQEIMTVVLPLTEYDHYLDSIQEGHYGVKLIRVAAWMVPYMAVLLMHRRMKSVSEIGYDVFYATLLSACISVVSTQYVYAARIETYFSLVAFLAVIRIPELFDGFPRKLVQWAMVALFFAFGVYQHSGTEYFNILFHEVSGVL